VPYEQVAQELFYQIEESEISFYEAAHLYDVDDRRRYVCGYEGKVNRWSLSPEIAAAIFSANIGQVVGPLKTEQGYHLFWAEEFIPATLTPEHRQEIQHKLFQDWLNQELNYLLNQH
jgi:parvulin-like peptidyl-prolyl isomerase